MPTEDGLQVTRGTVIPLREVMIRASRSSGPGGQHANVTASRIEAVFDVFASETLDPGQKQRINSRLGPRVVAIAQDARSQARNRELALERLERRLRDALFVPRARAATRPSRAERQRRLDAKRKTGERKQGRRRPDTRDE